MRDILLTSVPDAEADLARAHFPHADVTSARLDERIASLHSRARILCVAASDTLAPELLARLPRVEAILTRSDGYDHLPEAWMRERGVEGYHLGGYATEAVARFTIGVAIALLRRIPEGAARTRTDSWERIGLEGRDLPDVTVGILGTGRIGARVARWLDAFGTRTRAYDIAPDERLLELRDFAYADTLEDLLRASDLLTVHVPLTEATRGLLDARRIALLPPGACIVNTARGAVLDQAAVEHALVGGHLGGYAADVLPGEPAPPDLARFAGLPNVIITPHLAAYDRTTVRERYAQSARLAEALLAGRRSEAAHARCI